MLRLSCLRSVCVLCGLLLVGLPFAQAGTVVRFTTNFSTTINGTSTDYFDVELYDSAAPLTVANFLQYINAKAYDNSMVHRSEPNFVIQGGGFSPIMTNGQITGVNPVVNYGPVQNEYSPSRSNLAGTLAMAKVDGDPNSATNQWFVNVADNTGLDSTNGGFTVFGKVLGDGMTLVKAINGLTTQNYGGPFGALPFQSNGNLVLVTTAKVLTPAVTGNLTGSVYVDANHNGKLDGGDMPVADASVTLTRQGGNFPTVTATSGVNGLYRFDGVAPGMYTLKMQSSTGAAINSDVQVVVDSSGNVVSTGAVGTFSTNSYTGAVLGEGQTISSFNLPQSSYPTELISARMLLNDRIAATVALASSATAATVVATSMPSASAAIPQRGQGIGPVYSISSDALSGSTFNLGHVSQYSTTTSASLKVSNTSTDTHGGDSSLTDLTILDAKLSGDDAGLFSLEGLTSGKVLHQGESLDLTLRYNGNGAHGPHSATLSLYTDEGAALGGGGHVYTYDVQITLAPEPGTLATLAAGGLVLAGMGWRRWRRTRAKA